MNSKQPITDTLRDAINASDLSFLALGKATGVLRQSLLDTRGCLYFYRIHHDDWVVVIS